MAYHELLARVADSYQSSRRFDGDLPYEGLHQIAAEREIDPSLPPIDYRAFNEREGSGITAWEPPSIRLQQWPPAGLEFVRYRGDIDAFIADEASEPTMEDLLFARDSAGADWVVLEGSQRQVDPQTMKSWRGIQQHSATHTLFVTTNDADPLLVALPELPRFDLQDAMDNHGHVDCCYVGEVGRIGPFCPHRHDILMPMSLGEGTAQVVSTTEEYSWEGNILDCSIGESAGAVLPSTFIQQAAKLAFDMRGPSWRDAQGIPVFTYYEEDGTDAQALLVRASFLKEFMATQEVQLVATLWFERMLLDGDHRSRHPYVESTTECRIDSGLAVHASEPRRTTRMLEADL